MNDSRQHTPFWFAIIIMLAAAAMLATMPIAKSILAAAMNTSVLNWIYPAYIASSSICAYICYPMRRELAWILVLLMFINSAMLLLCNLPI